MYRVVGRFRKSSKEWHRAGMSGDRTFALPLTLYCTSYWQLEDRNFCVHSGEGRGVVQKGILVKAVEVTALEVYTCQCRPAHAILSHRR